MPGVPSAGHLPAKTMATNDSASENKEATADEPDDEQSCEYQPRQRVDERFLDSGRYEY